MILRDRVVALLEPLIEGLGYELVHVELHGQGPGSLLRLYIDKENGIDLGDCERVSREVSAALDVADPIQSSYRLEVSSPGMDRPLAKPEHYRRFAGRMAKLQTQLPVDGRRRFSGQLKGLDQDDVLMDVDGRLFRLPLAQIERARLVPEFDKN
jgi:ribosome maturation factor RimP